MMNIDPRIFALCELLMAGVVVAGIYFIPPIINAKRLRVPSGTFELFAFVAFTKGLLGSGPSLHKIILYRNKIITVRWGVASFNLKEIYQVKIIRKWLFPCLLVKTKTFSIYIFSKRRKLEILASKLKATNESGATKNQWGQTLE